MSKIRLEMTLSLFMLSNEELSKGWEKWMLFKEIEAELCFIDDLANCHDLSSPASYQNLTDILSLIREIVDKDLLTSQGVITDEFRKCQSIAKRIILDENMKQYSFQRLATDW